MGACERTNKLLAFVLVGRFFIPCVDYFVEHVDTNEVGHFCVHYFTFEELEREILIIGAILGGGCLNNHIFEVYFTFAYSCC